MTESARQDRLARILEEALDLPRAEREAFIARACGDDPNLRAEITDLLSREGQVNQFLDAAREAIADGAASEPFSAESVDPESETLGHRHPDLDHDKPGDLPDRAPGTRIRYFGDYELLEEIARGGMGVVYKARQVKLNRIVAIKMIRSGEFASDEEVQRFRSEAEAAANLQHPNIVAIHEMGEHDGQYYFSMDYVDGKNLEQLIKDGSLHITELIQILKKIAEAVHWAHQRGTLHRDLKPANIVIDKAGKPRITDFGLAKRIEKTSGLTRTGAAMGTPAYMPPEQALGRWDTFGPASEVYSLGAILYEMLTGEPPFLGGTSFETLWQLKHLQPVSPRSRNPRVPVELDTICLKCLEKQPHNRYPTAHALAEELRRFLSQEPIEARPPSLSRKAWRWSQQHPSVITTVIATVLLGILWLAYGLWFENSLLVLDRSDPDQLLQIEAGGIWQELGILLCLGALFGIAFVHTLFRRTQRKRILSGRRPRPSVLVAFGALGLFMTLLGVYSGTEMIEEHIKQQWRYLAEIETWERYHDASRISPRTSDASGQHAPTPPRWWELYLPLCIIPVFTILNGVCLVLLVLREHNFVFFTSVVAEQAAREQAELEEKIEEIDHRNRRRGLMLSSFKGQLLGLLGVLLCCTLVGSVWFISKNAMYRETVLTIFIAGANIGLMIGTLMAVTRQTTHKKVYWLFSGFLVVASGLVFGVFSYLDATTLPLVGWVAGVLGGQMVGLISGRTWSPTDALRRAVERGKIRNRVSDLEEEKEKEPGKGEQVH